MTAKSWSEGFLDDLEEIAHEQAERIRGEQDAVAAIPPEASVTELRPSLLAKLRNGDYLNRAVFPDLRWTVPAILPEGLTLLVGGPKLGKSWLAYGIGLAAACGGRALDQIHVGHARPVLYIALEDSDRRMQARGAQLLAGDTFPPLFEYVLSVEPGLVVEMVTEWLQQPHIKQHASPPLIVLDTLGKVMPDARRGETSYQRDYRIAGALHAICEQSPGMSVLVLHHDRKAAADDFVDTVSGTNGIAGAADTIIVLKRQRMADVGTIKITGRDVEEHEYALSFTDGRWALSGSLDEAAERAYNMRATEGLEQRAADVLTYVQTNGGADVSEVAAALSIDQKLAASYLSRLVNTGRLQRLKRGTYAP